MISIEELATWVSLCLLDSKALTVAGQVTYIDKKTVIPGYSDNGTIVLGIHTTGADKTQQAAERAWDALPEELKKELIISKVGFAVKQV